MSDNAMIEILAGQSVYRVIERFQCGDVDHGTCDSLRSAISQARWYAVAVVVDRCGTEVWATPA